MRPRRKTSWSAHGIHYRQVLQFTERLAGGEQDTGTAPQVLDAGFVINGDDTYQKQTFLDVGTSYRFAVVVRDPDLDANTVTIEEDNTPTTLELASQNQEDMLYLTTAYTPTEADIGQFTAYVTAGDAAGNSSNRFTLVYEVQNP